MELRILGQVELWKNGSQIHLGRAKERSALGVLLLNHGRPMSTETIMDALWDDDRPHHVHKDLQTYISRLRKTLRSADCGTEITSSHQSYSVRSSCMIDYHRSIELLTAGRRARQLGQLDAAADALHEAVDLWRGPVVADLRTLWIELRREELDNKLVSCQQALIDVELLRGNYGDALDLVNRAIVDHEFDISLISLRLRALHGCGYYNEFDSYWQQNRRRGIESFGTEPDRSLQDLHIRLLQDRDGVGAHAPPESLSLPPLPAPAQLPPPSAHFTGRDEEINDLQTVLDRTRSTHPLAMPVLAIVGSAGAGKSALAIEWCHTVRQRFPDGQLFADLAGYSASAPADPSVVLANFLTALGLRTEQVPESLTQRSALFRSMVDGRHILVLLDNARTTEQVVSLLPGSAACLVVVTSRHRLPDLVARHGARRMRIGPLPVAAIRELVQHGANIDNLGLSEAAAAELGHYSAGLPAVVLALGEHLAEHPHLSIAALLAELKRSPRIVLRLGQGETGERMISTVLTWSYDTLRPDTARLFRLLSLHPGHHFTCADAAAITAAPSVDAAQRQLDELCGLHLLEQVLPGRYGYAPVVDAYAADRTTADDTADDKLTAQRRLLDHYDHAVAHAARLLAPQSCGLLAANQQQGSLTQFSTVQEALQWLDAETPNLTAAIRCADDLGWPHAWLIPAGMTEYLLLTEHLDELLASHAIALQAADDAAAEEPQLAALRGLATAHRLRGQLDPAERHTQRWLAISATARLHLWRANGLLELARIRRVTGAYDDAISLCHQALDHGRSDNSDDLVAAAKHELGVIHAHRAELLEAVDCFAVAVRLRRQLRQPATTVATHRRLAEVHHKLGDTDQAAHHALAAITISDQQTARRRDTIHVLILLADIEYGNGNHLLSMTHSHRALALCHPTKDRGAAARALELLGCGLQALGKWEDANDEWQQAVELLTEIDDPYADQIRAQIAKHSPPAQHAPSA